MRFNVITPGRHGLFIVSKHDAYVGASLLAYGDFSEGEVDLYRAALTKESIVVEAGANIGALTVPLAGIAKAVFAIEPQLGVFHMLCGNVALNSLTNVSAIHAAAGSEVGSTTIPMLDPRVPNNFGGMDIRRPSPKRMPVSVITIDSMRLPGCDLLKVDVEGMEIDVMKGAAETITRCRPIMVCENDREENSESLIALVKSHDYRVFRHNVPLFSSDNWAGESVDIWGNCYSLNIVGIPRERVFDYPLGEEL